MDDDARRVFISYSHADVVFANDFAAALTKVGLNVWKDDKDLIIGDNILKSLYQGIRASSHFCCILSASSITSAWVEEELSFAKVRQLSDRSLKIVPVLIDPVVIPDYLQAYLCAHLENRQISLDNPEFVRILKAFGTDLTEYRREVLIGAPRQQLLDAGNDLQSCLVPFRELLGNYLRAEEAITSARANRGYDKPREVGGRIRATHHGSDYLIKAAEDNAAGVLIGLKGFARDLARSLERFQSTWTRVDPKHEIESLRRLLSNDLTLAAYMTRTIAGSNDSEDAAWWVRDKLQPWLSAVPGIEGAVDGARALLRGWAVFDQEAMEGFLKGLDTTVAREDDRL